MKTLRAVVSLRKTPNRAQQQHKNAEGGCVAPHFSTVHGRQSMRP